MTWLRWAYHAWGNYWFDHPAMLLLIVLILLFVRFVSSMRMR